MNHLFDIFGKRVMQSKEQEEYYLVQPDIDYAQRFLSLDENGLKTNMTVARFKKQTMELLARLRKNKKVGNILNGVYLPIIIPQTNVADLGQATEEFVAAVEKSYRQQFPRRSFINYSKGELVGQVSVVKGSRYEQLLERLAQGAVVGIYFPNPLQGYSIHAQREQMASLPENFILSGPLDIGIAWVMYPDVLGRDFHTPVNDCSAVQWQSPGDSLCFSALAAEADFGGGGFLSYAYGSCSGGLLFLG